MKRLLLFLIVLFVRNLLNAGSPPPFHSQDPGTQGNFEDIYNRVYSLRGLRDSDAAPRTNATPRYAGDIIFNSTDLELCYSTGVLKSQWALGNKTTPCSH